MNSQNNVTRVLPKPTQKPKPTAEQYAKGHAFRARPVKLIAFDVKEFNTSAARFAF